MNYKKILSATIILAVLTGGGVFAYSKLVRDNDQPAASEEVADQAPTEDESKAGDKQKEAIDQEEKDSRQNQQASGQKKQATVVITDASQYDGIIEVRSFISNHIQDGTCTLTFTKGNQTVTKQTPARADISTTICMNPNIKRSEFPSSGDWQVKIAYSSKDATGTSESQTVKIN